MRKNLWVWIIVIILVIGVLAYNNSDKLNINLNSSSSPSIKELSLNPQSYVGQNISISGKLHIVSGDKPYSLNDGDNYYVLLDPNDCVWGIQGQYKFDGTVTYTAKGTFVYDKLYYVKCLTHLE